MLMGEAPSELPEKRGRVIDLASLLILHLPQILISLADMRIFTIFRSLFERTLCNRTVSLFQIVTLSGMYIIKFLKFSKSSGLRKAFKQIAVALPWVGRPHVHAGVALVSNFLQSLSACFLCDQGLTCWALDGGCLHALAEIHVGIL